MGKLKRISSLFIVFLLLFSCSFSSYADVASGSDAIMTLDLDDEDYGIMPLSSIGTVTNTVVNKNSSVWVSIRYVDSSGVQHTRYPQVDFSNNRYSFSVSDLPAGSYINRIGFSMARSSVPPARGYLASMDFSSDFAVEYGSVRIYTENATDNAATLTTFDDIDFQQLSGDLYISPLEINLTSVDVFTFFIYPNSHDYSAFGGSFAVNFTPASVSGGALTTAGGNTSNEDYQSDVSSTLSDLSSSVDSMTEDLSSAAENLEYISTSQNLIIQGIDNVIMHISDQLYAFWDQLYNLIHEPQMAKMDEIIAAIRKVANDVDMSQVVDTIEDTTDKQIANDNANTTKIEEAVEAHGNFIIDGLKGLFIPSDEYFKSYFDDLYEYFSDRFGFLSFPIDLLSRLVDLFVNSSDVDCVLTLPGFEISGEQVWTDQSFNLTEFMETNFSFVLTAIRTVTSVYLIMAFVDLCREKWNEVMSN